MHKSVDYQHRGQEAEVEVEAVVVQQEAAVDQVKLIFHL